MGRVSWPALPGWWDKGLLGAQTEVVGTKEVHAAAGDVASERLGVCWVGVAKGGGTSLRGGDRERGPCVFLVRRSPVFLELHPPLGPGGATPGHLRGHPAASRPGLWVPRCGWRGLRHRDGRRLSQRWGPNVAGHGQPGGHLARELPQGPALQLLRRPGSPGLGPPSPARGLAAAEGDRAARTLSSRRGRWPPSPEAGAAVFVANICLGGS